MPTASVKPLSRKISAEEALDGFLRVEKAWLKKLPAPGTQFQLKLGNDTRRVRIDAEPCTCRGPDKPHEHYRLNLPLVTLEEGWEATLRPVNGEKVVLEMSKA